MEVRRVPAESTLHLRSSTLRQGLPLEASIFDNDDLPETIHYGAFLSDSLVGVGTFFPEKFPGLAARHPFRLRGMAVDPQVRRSGAGRALLVAAEKDLRAAGVDLLWFNAREAAFSFYSAVGYEFFGELFDIPGVGPHKVMFKRFASN